MTGLTGEFAAGNLDKGLMTQLAEEMVRGAGSPEGISADVMAFAQSLNERDMGRLQAELAKVAGGDANFTKGAVGNILKGTAHGINPDTGQLYTGEEIKAYHQPTNQDPNKLQDPGFIDIVARAADGYRAEMEDGQRDPANIAAMKQTANEAIAERQGFWRETIKDIMQEVRNPGVEAPVVVEQRADVSIERKQPGIAMG